MANVALILLAVSWVWLFLFDRADTCSLIARDRIYAFNLAATLWMLAMALIGGPPFLMALLTLPCLPVFLIAFWRGLSGTWKAWKALGLFTRNRKAA